MILTGQAGNSAPEHHFRYWQVSEAPKENFESTFDELSLTFPQSALGVGNWEIENPGLRALRDKLRAAGPTLKEVYGSPLYGIKTGANDAFVVDTETKDRLCRQDPRSAELLKPYMGGKDLIRWGAEPRGLWIIYIPQNRINIDEFPAIKEWLEQFRTQLEGRATTQNWFELQQAQEVSVSGFEGDKIIYPEFSRGPEFSARSDQYYLNNKIFLFNFVDFHFLALLNSKALWFILFKLCAFVIGGSRELRKQYIETLPIPPATDAQKAELAALAEAAQTAAEKRYALQQEITRRIPDLATGTSTDLSDKLKAWWDLPDFAAFQAEVKKALKSDIPLKARNEWENWIAENRTQIHALSAQIAAAEAEINAKVYALFNLTPEEIALLEANI